MGERSHLQIGGEPWYSKSINDEDPIDISIIRLNKEWAANLKKKRILTDNDESNYFNYKFLTLSDLELNHSPEFNSEVDNYMTLGYPASINKQIPTKEKTYNLKPHYIITRLIKPENNENLNLIALRKNKMYRVNDNKKVMSPAPWGISGGGLFHMNKVNQTIKLIGILKFNDRNNLIATKIDFYVKILRDRFNLMTLPNPAIQINYT